MNNKTIIDSLIVNYKQKKLNRIMLNEDGNEKKKTNKQICTSSTLFLSFFAVVLHDYNAILYD